MISGTEIFKQVLKTSGARSMLLMKNFGLMVRFECESRRRLGCCSRYRAKAGSRADLVDLDVHPSLSPPWHTCNRGHRFTILGKWST